MLLKTSEAAPAEDWGGLGDWTAALGDEGGWTNAVLLDISPVAVSAICQPLSHCKFITSSLQGCK